MTIQFHYGSINNNDFQMKQPRNYPAQIDYENLNMSSLLEGLEDIIGSHSDDSGIQASPQAPYYQGSYNKPRTRECFEILSHIVFV